MKTLENEKGLDLKPCLNCVACFGKLGCPCHNHSGEILRQNNIITRFSCANRKMCQVPKIKRKGLKKPTVKRSKQEA